MGLQKFRQDTCQDSTEVTVEIVNKGTGLVLPAIYTFACGKKYTTADIGETFSFLKTSASLKLEKMGVYCYEGKYVK